MNKLRQNTEGRWDKHMDTTGKKMQNNNITEVKEKPQTVKQQRTESRTQILQ